MPADAIWYQFHGTQYIVSQPPVDQLIYTDDTQMMIGVAEALILDGHIRQQTLLNTFVLNYHPDRGYGPGARRILSAVAAGEAADDLPGTIFPGGSLGNGAAMRVAPVGLLFHDDYNRLLLEAEQSALPTHRHPIGIDGARILRWRSHTSSTPRMSSRSIDPPSMAFSSSTPAQKNFATNWLEPPRWDRLIPSHPWAIPSKPTCPS